MGRKNRSLQNEIFWESAKNNKESWLSYYRRFVELSVSMFEWQNLPETVDPRFLELTLFSDGKAVFFEDEVLGHLALRCMVGGKFTVYNVPTERRAYAVNGYNKALSDKDSVIIYNNYMRTNSMLDCETFAKRLYELDRAIDTNAKAQKTPILIECEENELLSMKNLYMKYDGNQPVIFARRGIDLDNSIKVLKTDAPFVADRLYELRTQIWNEAMTYLGISNVSFQKKERLISDEVMRGNGGTIANRYARLEARRLACEEINKMFNLDIWVNFREDFREMGDNDITDPTIDKEEEVEVFEGE